MQEKNDLFFVLEGSDGSGKATQLRLLKERLEAAGYDVAVFDFPRYDEPSSYFVKQYLEGNFGPASEVSPYTASLFYALDRYSAAPTIRQALSEQKVVLSNRYVGSNMAHQGAKFGGEGEQRGFFLWSDSLEFQLMGIPRPSLNLFLRLPPEISRGLIDKRAKKDSRSLDQHESNQDHLRQAANTFDLLCKLFPKDFTAIDCAPSGKLLSIADVSDLVWDQIKPLLPPPSKRGHSRIVKLDKMERPSSPDSAQSEALLKFSGKRVKSQMEVELKGVSLLLLNSLRSLPFDDLSYKNLWSEKSHEGYYRPVNIPVNLLKQYDNFMSKLKQMRQKAEKSLSRGQYAQSLVNSLLSTLIPMASLVDIKIISRQAALQALAIELKNADLTEAQALLNRFISLTGVASTNNFSSTTDEANKPLGSLIKHLSKGQHSINLPDEPEVIELSDYWPRNEFDLLSPLLYTFSDMSPAHIKDSLSGLTYEQKSQALEMAATQPTSPFLAEARYNFSVLGDQLFLENLVETGLANHLLGQSVSPRFGYQLPAEIDDGPLEDIFLECFDNSLELYSHLQSAGLRQAAGYVCLAGHKCRWHFDTSFQMIKKIISEKTLNNEQLSLLQKIIQSIAGVHPLIGERLGFELKNANVLEKTASSRPNDTQKIKQSVRYRSATRRRRTKK